MSDAAADMAFVTQGGVRVRRTAHDAGDEAQAILACRAALDERRGAVFSSNYEYPGRYTRWDIGFVDPPLVLSARGRTVRIEALNLRVSSVRALLRPGLRERRLEAALLAAHVIGYVSLVLVALPVGTALLVVAVHQALFGVYLGCAFAPNHKGMPTRTGAPEPDFLRKQVLTSRNVRGGWLVDVALGGLNHQIEHHLFPAMPAPNLPRARPIVRAYCAELGVPYEETGLRESYAIAFRHLHEVGAELRSGVAGRRWTGMPRRRRSPRR